MSTTDIELRVQLEDALVQLEMERNLRDKAEQERDEALSDADALADKCQRLATKIETLTKERNEAQKQRLTALDLMVEAQATTDLKAEKLETLLTELEAEHCRLIASSRAKIAQLEADLEARAQLMKLLQDFIQHNQADARDMVRVFDDIAGDICTEDWNISVCLRDNYKNEGLALERRARDLLTQVGGAA